MTRTVLLIDDDPSVVSSLELLLKQEGFRSRGAADPEEALALLREQPFQLVLLDMNFSRRTSGEEGLSVLARLKALHPDLPVILMTAWGSIQLAVEGMKAGASDFITKPWSNDQLLRTVKTTLGLADACAGADGNQPVSRTTLDARYDFSGLVGEDRVFLRMLDIAGRISPTDASVLITGESGTGKELVAEAIHRNSGRAPGSFVKVNLGGISHALFESEMFGHVRGAFTDAKQAREGRFGRADGGTIFLDEIGDLDADCQVKLLRVLQDRSYEVLGSSETRTVDVRVISATNRNLYDMIEAGDFREDLLYRLNLISLHIPPLRDRPGDIKHLVRQFTAMLSAKYHKPDITATPEAITWLQNLRWPGNVRELRQLVERTALLSASELLTQADFMRAFDMHPFDPRAAAIPVIGELTLDEMERAVIEQSMERFGNNVSTVAEALGISQAALYRRLKKYGIKL